MSTLETVYPYALTTLARVKDRLNIMIDDNDPLLTRLINGATDYIERACGKTGLEFGSYAGHFALGTYTNEVYSVFGARQKFLVLRNAPLVYVSIQVSITVGSTNATASNVPTASFKNGMPITGDGIAVGTTLTDWSSSNVTLSQPATINSSTANIEISGLLGFQWRAGTPSNPNWTSFITDQYELLEQGHSGIIRVYGTMPRVYSNMLRATYVAGYPIDWQNAGNGTSHQLPADLTNTCENLVVRIYKRRLLEGKASEAIQGATTSWRDQLDAFDKETIQNYKRVGNAF
jgi:hypothetical protein